ncbi:sensor histidine kinase [Rothia mucilaginosa]|uniref:sensor histidine kinase n=1 Tax=Rothia mucilaginosa TaxID=43675 RepID=UPI0026ECDE74|nr:PAS domain-containing sensor histidine kinase [Rothia mucilaginosa]
MSFAEGIMSACDFGPGDTERVHLIMGEWQVISDIAQSDLVLWFPTDYVVADGSSPDAVSGPSATSTFRAFAHVRPSNVRTLFHHDIIERDMEDGIRDEAYRVWIDQNISTYTDEGSGEGVGARPRVNITFVPIVRNNRTIALLTSHKIATPNGYPSISDEVYEYAADTMLSMVHSGLWPDPLAQGNNTQGNPRVIDGIIVLDPSGRVVVASPNANSMYNRMGMTGYLEKRNLADVTRAMLPAGEQADETLQLVLAGRSDLRTELVISRARVTMRSIPLLAQSRARIEREGAVILCRDVTELRRRELELMTKDATIREIHHRVKNNLQTVSALLRLQSRRMTTDEARQGLEQAMRRVATIATVHEALSQGLTQNVDFDELIERQFHLAAELASPGQHVSTKLIGSFGALPSQFATPLALVINEVVANAVEHGLDGETGTVTLEGIRGTNEEGENILTVVITDDGKGLGDKKIEESGPNAYRPVTGKEGLGMQIVRTLVASELNGSIRWEANEPKGTRVVITAALI